MAETDIWLAEFGQHHRNISNPGIYWASLMPLLTGTVGLLWALPIPDEFTNISPLLNWGSAFLMAALVYYFIISISLGLGMVPFVLGVGVSQVWLAGQDVPLGCAACILAGLGVAGLSFSHYAGGGMRAVLRDIQLIMIAPIWLLSDIYRRLGIPF